MRLPRLAARNYASATHAWLPGIRAAVASSAPAIAGVMRLRTRVGGW